MSETGCALIRTRRPTVSLQPSLEGHRLQNDNRGFDHLYNSK